MQETWVQFLGQKDLLEKKWLPTPVFLPGEFYGQRRLVGYSPRGCKELDMIEQLTHLVNTFFYFQKHIQFVCVNRNVMIEIVIHEQLQPQRCF